MGKKKRSLSLQSPLVKGDLSLLSKKEEKKTF
jgi:hypothetical protein